MYHVRLKPGTPVAGREVRSLGLADMGVVIVTVIRGEGEIVPHGGTVLQVSDRLLVAAKKDAIETFQEMVKPVSAPATAPAAGASGGTDSASAAPS
jgi:Trk K+ transport system NAD-binding subunit